MTEVNRDNFDEYFSEIQYKIQKSHLVAVDCEFSGLSSNSAVKNSLFDIPAERYLILRENVGQFIPLQVGLSIFTFNRDLNEYSVSSYRFFIIPLSIGRIDTKFLSQASSVEFLCRNNFDYNKAFYSGIPYLSKDYADSLMRKVDDNSLFNYIYLTMESEELEFLSELFGMVRTWWLSKEKTETLTLKPPITSEKFFYVTCKYILKHFPNAWTFRENNLIRVKRVSTEERSRLEKETGNADIKLVNYYNGFSRIYQLLIEKKKPIIGHNLLLDLIITYHQFHLPLPSSLKQFKVEITKMFPSIYDTKLLTYEFIRNFDSTDRLSSSSLSNIYHFLANNSNAVSSFSPRISKPPGLFDEGTPQQIHDAAWDSYMTGYTFIKLCHFMAVKKQGDVTRPLTSLECFCAVEDYKNKVNLPRAAYPYINLCGNEDKSRRPPVLYLATKNRAKIDLQKVYASFSKYGGVDFKQINSHSILLALSNFGSARLIMQDFKKSQEYSVERYSYFRHSNTPRICLWAGVIIPLAVSIIFCLKSCLKSDKL